MNRPHTNGSILRECANREIPAALKDMLKGGLALLWRGFEYARDLDRETSEFAVEGEALYRAGMSAIDLQWLLARGYVEATSKPPQAAKRESFEKNGTGAENTLFILTKSGAALALQIYVGNGHECHSSETEKYDAELDLPSRSVTAAPQVLQKPNWDRDRKELRLGHAVIKQFRCAAINQETILMAFEEENWPARIDDPLPQKLNQDPKTRLHDTIKCLNQNHQKRLIRFTGDGTGEGVLWVRLDDAETDS